MVKGKQNKDKTIRVQPIAFFFGGTPGGAVKCIVRRRTGAPTKVVQHPDVDDVEPGLDDEHTFSGLNYIKNDQRSRLGSGNSHDHLVWAMRMFISTLFTLDTFPYAAVIKEWQEKRRVI
ncbi:hypothetical protein FOA52_009067 [Chlamydomonas sp. UWO 241]|nr:hypothetical protein FOA52_009067 [Chlamydomonas sp. UWO 241]